MRIKSKKNKNGYITILVVVIISMLLLLSLYFIDYIINDTKISQSQKLSLKTYYLAEAGINEAIWKLSHDSGWNASFSNNPTWQGTISRTDIFEPGDSYTVVVQNVDLAKAEITATAHLNSPGQLAQRLVKTKVYKALIDYLSEEISVYSSARIQLLASTVSIVNSNLYTQTDIQLNIFSTLNVTGDVEAKGQIIKSWTSTINAANIFATNYPPPPTLTIGMPQIDFDSEDSTSYLSRANQVYSSQQFQNLLESQENITLNGITYVQGSVNLPKGKNLTINGVLVCDDNVQIGVGMSPPWQYNSTLTINTVGEEPAGLLTKKNITFGPLTGSVNIHGLLYAANNLKMDGMSAPFLLNGGIITNNLNYASLWQPITIQYDQNVIIHTLGGGSFAPIINIEHWEEEY